MEITFTNRPTTGQQLDAALRRIAELEAEVRRLTPPTPEEKRERTRERNRLWHVERRAKGLCNRCDRPTDGTALCRYHQLARRE